MVACFVFSVILINKWVGFNCHVYNYLARQMRYKGSEAKWKEAMRGESNHLSRLVCTYQITADIQVLKSGFMYITNWAYFSSFKKCQTSLKYSKLSSKFINYGSGWGRGREAISGAFPAN